MLASAEWHQACKKRQAAADLLWKMPDLSRTWQKSRKVFVTMLPSEWHKLGCWLFVLQQCHSNMSHTLALIILLWTLRLSSQLFTWTIRWTWMATLPSSTSAMCCWTCTAVLGSRYMVWLPIRIACLSGSKFPLSPASVGVAADNI